MLLKIADIAMYRAKSYGRNGFQFYMPEINQRAAERFQLETALYGALQHRAGLEYRGPPGCYLSVRPQSLR